MSRRANGPSFLGDSKCRSLRKKAPGGNRTEIRPASRVLFRVKGGGVGFSRHVQPFFRTTHAVATWPGWSGTGNHGQIRINCRQTPIQSHRPVAICQRRLQLVARGTRTGIRSSVKNPVHGQSGWTVCLFCSGMAKVGSSIPLDGHSLCWTTNILPNQTELTLPQLLLFRINSVPNSDQWPINDG